MRPTLVLPIACMALIGGSTVSARSGPPPETVDAAPSETRRHSYAAVLMGVRMEIVLYAPDEETGRIAAKDAFGRIAVIEQVASTYRGNSELSRLVKRRNADAVVVSQDLFNLLEMSKRLHESTDGAFDCSVYKLVQAWRRAAEAKILPEPLVFETLRRISRSDQIELDGETRSVKLKEGVAITLDGIAKGYAGDAALEVLKAHGISRALIDLSGDVVIGDPPPGEEAWSVSLDFGDPDVPTMRLALANCAVATSGDTEQFFEIDGVRYSHIIDPRTGMACTNRTAACVIAPTGSLADALATAACVLGTADASEVLARFEDVSARVRTLGLDRAGEPDEILVGAQFEATEPDPQ